MLSGVNDAQEAMVILSSKGMIPLCFGIKRYFFCDGEYKRSPQSVSDVIRWAAIASRRITKIERIAIDAMLKSKNATSWRHDESPCVVWGFGLDGWIKSDADEYGVRLVSVKPYEAIITI